MKSILRLPQQHLLLAAISITSIVSAQSFNPLDSAPQCVQSCGALTSVAGSCANAGSAVGIAYCFCTNPTIAGFPGNPGICGASCTDGASQAAGSQWFAALCANPGTVTGGAAPATSNNAASSSNNPVATTSSLPVPAATTLDTTVTPTATSIPIVPAPTGTTTTATPTPSLNSDGDYVAPDPGSWWHNHGRWVIMVIVLVIAFTIIIIGGIMWKKRYNRKHNLGDALPPGTHWGPAQQHPIFENDNNVMPSDQEKGLAPANRSRSASANRSRSASRPRRGPSAAAFSEKKSTAGRLKRFTGR